MEDRLIGVNKKNKKELIWILEHSEIYTAGTSYSENDVIDKSIKIFKTNREASIGSGTVSIQSDAASGNMAFTRLNKINVVGSAVLHIGAGTTFKMNVLDVF